jgi:Immunomodulating metalloprotease helical domain/Peptidase M60, enhancin and enhancin-like/N-terminal domain of M60-like peptidases
MSALTGIHLNRILSVKLVLAILLSFYGVAAYAAANKPLAIKGFPSTSIIVGQDYSFIPVVKSKNRAQLIFKILNKPTWILFNAKTGGMSGRPTAANVGITNQIIIVVKDRNRKSARLPSFNLTVLQAKNVPVTNGLPTTNVGAGNEAPPPNVPEVTNPPIMPEMALEDALRTGNASSITTETLLNAGIAQAQSESNYCSTELAKIYPTGLQQTAFPVRSAYMVSNSSRNVPLHAADSNGSTKVYSWMGTKETGSTYAVLGTNVFSFVTVNTDLKNNILNLFRWLLKRDSSTDILNQPLVVLIPDYWDRQSLQAWFTANGLTHNWTITDNATLLDTGNYDLYLADVRHSVTNIQKAFAANKPVLAYNNWYEPPAAALAEFDLSWDWYGGQAIGNMACVAEQCSKASASPKIQELLSNLQVGMPAFNYEATDCPNNTGKVNCSLGQVTDSNGKSVETAFNQGATAIRSQLMTLDSAGINVFSLVDDKRLLKLVVLLADKYRENIHYPMDKASTDGTTFYRALFADNAVHYARPNNLYQPDMGDFTNAQEALSTAPAISKTLSYTPTVFDEWTSTGLYAPPGKTITVRRTDSGTSNVKLRFNFLRESTRLWNSNKYSRPRYMSSPSITLRAGQTYTFSTPYGGPIYLGWSAVQSGATPFTVEFSNVSDNPLLQAFDNDSINFFLNDVESTNSDWIDIKTPYAEIHTLKSHMLSAFAKQDGNSGNGYTYLDVQAYIDDLNQYLIVGNYAYAGFTDAGLPALSTGVQAFCSAFQLTSVVYDGTTKNLCTDAVIHAKPKIQHINSDVNALCGSLCSGNPFDSSGPILPLDWGENHEIGHNLQRDRLNIYGQSGEVSNNIFPLHTQWSWTVAKGLGKHPTQDRPANPEAFNILQNAITASIVANVSHPLWSGTGTYDNAFERLSFYVQLAYTQQSWDLYTKMYSLERIYSDAIKSEAKWAAVKDRLGFGNYTRADAANITAEDFMYIAASTIGDSNYSDYFEAWGIEISQAAKNQVAANNIMTQLPKLFYYVNNELPAAMPTNADTMPLNGTSLWADPTP